MSNEEDRMTEQGLAAMKEVMSDALDKPYRLSAWETKFCEDMLTKIDKYGLNLSLSPKQAWAVENIERKVYAS